MSQPICVHDKKVKYENITPLCHLNPLVQANQVF